MIRKLAIVVILFVFARPAYDFVMEWIDRDTPVVEDVAITEPAPNSAEVSTAVSTPFVTTSLPKKIETLEQLTDAFSYYFSRYETEFTIDYKGSTADIDYMLTKAIDDALARDSYVAGHLSNREMKYEYKRMSAKIHVSQTYLTDAEQEKVVDQKIAALVATVDPASMSDFQKAKFVNDYIVQNTVYSEDTNSTPHSAYTLVQEGKAVCQGYALFATKFLRALGLQADYIVGDVYSGAHAWNLVKVDGEWFHLDTTWNDPVPDRGMGVRYEYFLISDSKMKVDHVWIEENYVPATSERYAYMHMVENGYEQDGILYYSNNQKNNQLYRLNLQTGENVQLANTRAQHITGAGEWLYFSNYSNGAYLTKIKKDGTSEQLLLKEEVKDLYIKEGYLHFTTKRGSKRMAL